MNIKESIAGVDMKWYPIPFGLGLLVLCIVQIKHMRRKELERREKFGYTRQVIQGPWSVS